MACEFHCSEYCLSLQVIIVLVSFLDVQCFISELVDHTSGDFFKKSSEHVSYSLEQICFTFLRI